MWIFCDPREAKVRNLCMASVVHEDVLLAYLSEKQRNKTKNGHVLL